MRRNAIIFVALAVLACGNDDECDDDEACGCIEARRLPDGTCCLGFTRPEDGVCVARHWIRPDQADAWGEPGVAEVTVVVDSEGRGVAGWVAGPTQMPDAREVVIAEEIDGVWVEQQPGVALEGFGTRPSIAAGPEREVLFAWKQALPDPPDATVPNDVSYLAQRGSDGAWMHPSADAPLSLPPAGYDPVPLATAWGDALVVWNQWTGAGYGVALAARVGDEAFVGPADSTDVLSPPVANSNEPRVAVGANGDALVVWYQASVERGRLMVYASERFRVGSAFSRPEADAFLSAPGADAAEPVPAIGERGFAAVVWTQGVDEDSARVYLATRDGFGTWTRPADLGDTFGPAMGNAEDARVVFGRSELHVVWSQDLGVGARIWAAHRDAAGAWDEVGHDPTLLSSPDREAIEPSLAVGPHGEVIAVWSERGDDGRLRIAARRRNAGADRWSELDVLSPTDGHDATRPVVAIGSTGRALVAWQQGPSGQERVRFAAME